MEEKNQFQIKTEVFEGPLDLLLSLIEKQKLHINDISLAKVTEDYIAYINAQKDFPMGQSADFILVASTLLLIKSKSLLPSLELTLDETGDIADLERRLKLYQRIKELSRHVREKFGKEVLFARLPSKEINPVFSPDKSMTVKNLFSGVRQAINNIPKIEKLAKAVVDKVISLEEMVKRLTDRVTQAMRTTFKEFSRHNLAQSREQKIEVVVSFLAMLELVKQGIIRATQENLFEDIHMETDNVATPRYH